MSEAHGNIYCPLKHAEIRFADTVVDAPGLADELAAQAADPVSDLRTQGTITPAVSGADVVIVSTSACDPSPLPGLDCVSELHSKMTIHWSIGSSEVGRGPNIAYAHMAPKICYRNPNPNPDPKPLRVGDDGDARQDDN